MHLHFRYLNNVRDERIPLLIAKAREEGFYISSVASHLNMWAIVMDTCTGFIDQIYKLSPRFFHKVILWSEHVFSAWLITRNVSSFLLVFIEL